MPRSIWTWSPVTATPPFAWKVTRSRRVPISPVTALVPVAQCWRNWVRKLPPAPATAGPPSAAFGITSCSADSV